MTAATPAGVTSALRRAALLAGILAVIVGFLGMHIFSGSHGMHSQYPLPGSAGPAAEHSAAPASATALDAHASHKAVLTAPVSATATPVLATPTSVTPASSMPASVTAGGTQVPASCVCAGGCGDKPAVHVACTPSPAGASLSAPTPGTTPLAMQSRTRASAAPQPDRTYRPGTPTPLDLSISRT